MRIKIFRPMYKDFCYEIIEDFNDRINEWIIKLDLKEHHIIKIIETPLCSDRTSMTFVFDLNKTGTEY